MPAFSLPSSSPFEIASRSLGTVSEIEKSALSEGWSLHGYQLGEPWGSFGAKAPSLVAIQPSVVPSGSFTGFGLPPYSTSTTNCEPAAIGVAGVISSSCEPAASDAAAAPSTLTARAFICGRRSRLKRSRPTSAVAVITATPSSLRLFGEYSMSRS